MYYDRIIKYLTYIALILLFLVLVKYSIRYFKPVKPTHEIKWSSSVLIGPPYPYREITGSLPYKSMLYPELIRRGVPNNIIHSYINMLEKYINNKNYRNGDWFSLNWWRGGVISQWSYYRKNRFIYNGELIDGEFKEDYQKCDMNNRKIVNINGVIEQEGFFWDLRKKMPSYIVSQISDIFSKTGDFKWPVPVNTKWRTLYVVHGNCPGRVVYFGYQYPQNVTKEIFYYYNKGSHYYNKNGDALNFIPLKIGSLENMLIYKNDTFFLRSPAPVISPMDGKITGLDPLVIENNSLAKLICYYHLNNGKIGQKISKGTVLIGEFNKQYKCIIKNIKDSELSETEKERFFEKMLDYIKFLIK